MPRLARKICIRASVHQNIESDPKRNELDASVQYVESDLKNMSIQVRSVSSCSIESYSRNELEYMTPPVSNY